VGCLALVCPTPNWLTISDRSRAPIPYRPSRWRNSQMRSSPIGRWIGWASCGVLVSVFVLSDLQSFCCALGWNRRVAEWIVDLGFGEAIASKWMFISVFFPSWLVAAILGCVVGLCNRRGWFSASLACGIAYVLTPEICCVLCVSLHPVVYFGWWAWLRSFGYSALLVPVMVLSAMAISGARRSCKGRPDVADTT